MGAAARALKVMGLRDLVLVTPREPPGDVALHRATGAADVLDRARTVVTLAEAVEDCVLVVGLSARARHEGPDLVGVREGVRRGIEASADGPVAFVFGTERSGLTNDELLACHVHASIPTGDELHSLNLAAAVQVVCYEILQGSEAARIRDVTSQDPVASRALVDALTARLWELAESTGQVREGDARFDKIRERLVRFLARARPTESEVRAGHGLVTWYNMKLERQGDSK